MISKEQFESILGIAGFRPANLDFSNNSKAWLAPYELKNCVLISKLCVSKWNPGLGGGEGEEKLPSKGGYRCAAPSSISFV